VFYEKEAFMKTLWNTLGLFILLSVLTGLAYPLAMTGMLETIFPSQANGSLLPAGGKIAGSALLAQKFTSPKYFWPRPSAADFATVPSGASNWGPTSAALKKAVQDRTLALRAAHGLPAEAPVPADLVFASASGLDPHISPEAAQLQIGRVAASRGLSEEKVKALVGRFTEPPQWGFLGQARVNVLLLNVALDEMSPKQEPRSVAQKDG
jgi:K+-transporting ATPase ATPase C chain